MSGDLVRERAREGLPSPALLVAAVASLVVVELVVGLVLTANVALYAAVAVVAVPAFVLVFRHPTAIAYMALVWLMFEKSAGTYDPGLTGTLSTAGDLLLVFALFWAVLSNMVRRRTPILRFGQIGGPLLAFVAVSIASTFANGVPPNVAELGISDTIRSLIMFLVVVNIGISATDVHRFVYWVVGIMSLSALVGVLQFSPHSPAWALGGLRFAGPHGLMRVDGLFDHPLSLGDYLALTAPLGIMLLAFGKVTGRYKTWLAVSVVTMLVALVLTFAREAWVAIPVAILFVGLTVDRRVLKVAIPPIAVLAALAVPFVGAINKVDSGQQRFTLFRLTLPLIKTHLLLGAGPGRYGGHVAAITHTPLYAEYHVANFFYGTGNQIDQFWTHLLAETGILGVVTFLAMIMACFLAGRRAYLDSGDPRRRAIILGLLCAVPSAVVLSAVSSTLEEGPSATLFWGLMGMMSVLALQRQPETVAEEPVRLALESPSAINLVR